MLLSELYDGSDAPFEGDLALVWRSLPDQAQVTKATLKLTPLKPPTGTLFEEAINFPPTGAVAAAADGRGDWGATKTKGSGFVEVDFHKRRTLAAVRGTFPANTSLQVDVGGLYVDINQNGGVRFPNDSGPLEVKDGKLPGLTVSKFKSTKLGSTVVLKSVTIRSVPTNVSVRLGKMLPFWTRLGELTTEDTSPDFAQILQAFLASAKVENGFYAVPLVVHSDTIARLKVDLEVEYLSQASVLPEGLKEVVLPFDFSTLPKAQADVLKVALPPNAKVVPGNTTARVIGAFEETRVVYGPTGAVKPAAAASVSPADSQAQVISLDAAVAATGVDLLIAAIKSTVRLGLDLQGDLDGKPDGTSLLPRSIEFGVDVNVARQPTWVSVPLPVEFHFEASTSKSKKRYWLVVQSIDGEAAWSIQQAPAGALPMQHTQDGGLSWRDTTSSAVAGPLAAFLRLRRRPERFEVPVELQVGTGDQAARVKLDRFQPTGRVDFALNFPEVADALNQSLSKAAAAVCSEAEHVANGDFEQWIVVGDTTGEPSEIKLPANSEVAGPVIVAPDGQRAYLGADADGSFSLQVVDVACDELLPTMEIKLKALDLEERPLFLTIHPNGSPIYVLGEDGTLGLVDTTMLKDLGAPLDSFESPKGLAVSPDGGELYIATVSNLQAVDTAALEQAVRSQAKLPQTSLRSVSPALQNEALGALAISPDGSQLFTATVISSTSTGRILVVDTATLTYDANDPKQAIPVAIQPTAIALTPDGKLAVVAGTGRGVSPALVTLAVILIDTATAAIIGQVPLEGVTANAVASSPDGMRAFVASNRTTPKVSVVDLKRLKVREKRNVKPNPSALAITPQGDRVYVASPESSSLTFIPIGTRMPAEWSVTSGTVRPFCLPEPFHLAALLGATRNESEESPAAVPTALSQVTPVAGSCNYDFSFCGLSTDVDAVAEVLWLGGNCGLLRTDQIPIQVGQRPEGTEEFVSALVAGEVRLFFHRKRLAAPAGATRAEVRFVVPTGVLAAIDKVSLAGTAEAVANGDLGIQRGSLPDNWTLSPRAAPGFLSVPGDTGVQLRNSGPATAELVQTAEIKAEKPFALEFQGRALLKPGAQANPRVELRWLKSDRSSAGPPTSLEILPTGFNHYPANGMTPAGTTQVEIHLIVPSRTTLEVSRVSLRSVEPTTVPLTFIAQAPGELRVSDARVAYDTAEIAPPPVPATGLCTPTPPDRKPGETPAETCFCHACQAERTITRPQAVVTGAGRPAVMGRCQTCGSVVVRAGGRLVAEAPRLSLPQLPVGPSPVPAPPVPIEEVSIPPLTAITGLGEARARRLVESGIDSVPKLAAASPEAVAKALKATGVAEENASRFIEKARELLPRK